jgi:hypothetical protein
MLISMKENALLKDIFTMKEETFLQIKQSSNTELFDINDICLYLDGYVINLSTNTVLYRNELTNEQDKFLGIEKQIIMKEI